ncbi:MAG TPA: nuclear transport factor 2 family protein [Candidatus Binataceae bacterium]|nr:nuclear transport factor 2 family protein [Candidatus Binataceae bacterium]
MRFSGTVEDREEIRELYARYCLAIDQARYDDWRACFTEDGVFESPRFGRCAGQAGLRHFCSQYQESLGGARSLHVVANISLEITGDTATGSAYFLYSHCKDGRVQQASVGVYADELRKTPAGWRFASRLVSIWGHN